MKTKNETPRRVTVNKSQGLYVIPAAGGGWSCLGFQVCEDRATRLAKELGEPLHLGKRGSLRNYRTLAKLQGKARATGRRFSCELSPQLLGLEGRRVEVVDDYGDTRRFTVGRSTGFLPIHLEIPRRDSSGGPAASRHYKSVRVIR